MDAFTTPSNWQKVKLGDIGKPCMCKRVMKHQTTPYGEIPFYKIGTFGNTADAFISKKLFLEYKTKYSFPKKGDILISASGTIGRAVIYDGKPAYFQDSNIVWIDNDETLVKNDFLFYVYSHVKWNTEHTTILRLYNDNFRNTLIPLPPLNEQIAIANILSDVDHYLYSLDALILKKESVKKALRIKMLNQILASNGVEFKKIGEICLIKRGRVIAKKILQENGKYPVYSSQTLNNGILGFIDTYDFDGEFLTWTTDGAYAGSVFYRNGRFSITNVCGLLQVIQDNILHKYLYYILQITAPLHVSSGMGNPKLMSAAMQQIQIPILPLKEQIAIANVLSDLDNEIISLKNKKRQFENIKKALNHDLMSTKIKVLNK
ncbi:restriction endonuclease subunit S [Helicobacter pylori]|uniref:restriction endonuclease subunit S n=1 Tax=Helicobacter pylori TaxID=210 RepID=UPI00099310B2|nr:restriction endonuclease subunit S [Helicobacter pylori]OOQ25479.1 restriction endonuclease subunit S [Helicobacter pylori]PDW56521.1 restriction endonuclease subunit S [Helicobacter pylori]